MVIYKLNRQPAIGNRLVQRIVVEESTNVNWLKCHLLSFKSRRLTFTTFWIDSADNKLMIFSYFSVKIGFEDISKPILGENENYFKMLSAEIFT